MSHDDLAYGKKTNDIVAKITHPQPFINTFSVKLVGAGQHALGNEKEKQLLKLLAETRNYLPVFGAAQSHRCK